MGSLAVVIIILFLIFAGSSTTSGSYKNGQGLGRAARRFIDKD